MEVIPLRTRQEVGRLLADTVETLLRSRPDAVLGLATGSSPLPAYEELIARHRAGNGPSYASARVFILDEYVGLPTGHPRTYRATIERELTGPLDIDPANVRAPDSADEGLASAGTRYEAAIAAAGGIDLQVLGVGTDGHLAFNEPGSSLTSRTRLKTLTRQTRSDNARYFGSPAEVPQHVVTQGLGTILEARHLVLVASGSEKADAVAAAVEGPVSASCPASVLQLHPHVSVILERCAASALVRLDYYLEVYAEKPHWQGL